MTLRAPFVYVLHAFRTCQPMDRPCRQPRYKRVLLKVSGEVLMGDQAYGIDMPRPSTAVAEAVAQVARRASRSAWSSAAATSSAACPRRPSDMERASADYMGMLATVMNALAMQAALEKIGVYDPGAERHSHEGRRPSPISAAAPCVIWKRAGW